MPLADIATVSLPQMTNPRLASEDEIAALDTWIDDLNACRGQLLEVTYATIPSLGPIIEEARNEDYLAFVKLARRRQTWGETVMRLMSNRTKLRADVIARVDQVIGTVGEMQQEQLNRRSAILSSVIRILP
jgi:hypothetical protein